MLGAARRAGLPVEVTVRPVYIGVGQREARKCWGIFVITQAPGPGEAASAAEPAQALASSEAPSGQVSQSRWMHPWAWAFHRVAGHAAA